MQQDQSSVGPSPFEVVTPNKTKKGMSGKSIIIALSVVVFLALGVFVGVLLVRQNQNIAEKASVDFCPGAQQCPTQDGKHLMSCDNKEGDDTPADSLCNLAGRKELCGGRNYCCPAAGGNWTTDMTKCTTPSPSASATATATSTATSTATATSTSKSTATSTAKSTATGTATATSTATSSATKAPVPETGTGWPTIGGIVLGVGVIVASFLLAF